MFYLFLFGVEGVVQFYYIWMLDRLEDLLLPVFVAFVLEDVLHRHFFGRGLLLHLNMGGGTR